MPSQFLVNLIAFIVSQDVHLSLSNGNWVGADRHRRIRWRQHRIRDRWVFTCKSLGELRVACIYP